MSSGFSLQDVSFAYEDREVLRELSLSLDPGKFYGIIGPNGCGKSTLVDLLVRHRRPREGEITYRGKDLSRYPKKALAQEMALVPQNFYINFPFTAREIVMMGRYPHLPRFSRPSPEDESVVDAIMKSSETAGLGNRLVTELSSGERQRVVFARALAQEAPVLVLDEATSNLDINHTLNLLDLAGRRVKQDHMVVAVFQDINLAAVFCHHLILMKEGRIAVHGPTEDVLTPETLDAVFQIRAKVYFEPYCQSKQVVFSKRNAP